jgi:hypothetical protein
MATDYLPPPSTRIPFNFTEKGYEAPNSNSVLFNFTTKGSFGTLKAAINVMQPYWETTHTYPKTCPKYIVGYGPGGVQIIKGRCTFGGIRDLQGTINGFKLGQEGIGLHASINGILNKGQEDLNAILRITLPSDLPAEIDTHPPIDLPASLEGIKFKGTGDLDAFLDSHTPRDLQAYIGAHSPVNLPATLIGELFHGDGDISGSVKTHPPRNLPASVSGHQYGNLGVILKAWKYGAIRNLPGNIYGWIQAPDLSAEIDTHDPQDLNLRIRGWAREVSDDLPASLIGFQTADLQGIVDTHLPENLRGIIRAWHRGIIGDLPTVIRMWQQEELPAEIGTHPWVDLAAKVLPHPPPPLYANIRGWVREVTANLPAPIYGWQELDLPVYMSGFQPGNLGIILKAWVYGAQQDMPANIHGWQEGDLGLITKGGHPAGNLGIIMKGVGSGVVDLPAPIHGWQEGDLGMTTKGGHSPGNLQALIDMWQRESVDLPGLIHGWQELDIPAYIATHQPGNVVGIIKGIAQAHGDLIGILQGYDELDLSATVGTHQPENLVALIKPGGKLFGNLKGIVHGWDTIDLGMTLAGTHYPRDLGGYIGAQSRRERDLFASVYGWVTRDLRSSLNIVYEANLPAEISLVIPVELPAYLKVRYRKSLMASMHGYDESYLGAYIRRIYEDFLSAKINPLTDTNKTLRARIKGYGEDHNDLNTYIMPFQWRALPATLYVKYKGDLFAYVFPVRPRSLKGIIHGWDEKFLQAILNVADYPWNLTASIASKGYLQNLPAYLAPVRGVAFERYLSAYIQSYEDRSLPASVFVENAGELWATLIPHMQASNLPAYIRPKMIRLTTIVNIPTLMARDLSAIINYPCFRTGYANLSSFIWAKYKGDLYATIRGYIPIEEEGNLGAKIGYADSYTVTDTFKLGLDLLPSKYYVEDIFKLHLYALSQRDVLGAYIRATPHYRGLAATVIGDDIPTFAFPQIFKNREKVIHTSYTGEFETFEVVEMAFKSAVKEYYYSAIGGTSWPANNLERWMLDVRSMLPVNLSLRLKRRLHRATTVYDFRKFRSVDEAIKYAIAYVTEWPEGNLGATINNRSRHEQLGAMIVPRYVRSERSTMSAYVNPLKDAVVVSEQHNISKIN